jgi:hypothetical protein
VISIYNPSCGLRRPAAKKRTPERVHWQIESFRAKHTAL